MQSKDFFSLSVCKSSEGYVGGKIWGDIKAWGKKVRECKLMTNISLYTYDQRTLICLYIYTYAFIFNTFISAYVCI